LLACKCKKALINYELLIKIKTILLDPQNTSLYNKNTQIWARKQFRLEEVVPDDYRVIIKTTNNSVLITEKMYE
ncbi:18135_t:CDS:1, partial [Cetraspora pellucida]